jgi:hypothetical protein
MIIGLFENLNQFESEEIDDRYFDGNNFPKYEIHIFEIQD